jgi:hypothetical protein
VDLPYEEIRQYLLRAVGVFLLDDVDVPPLVWFTASEDDIYVLDATAGKKNWTTYVHRTKWHITTSKFDPS